MANFWAFYPPGSGGGSNASVGVNGQTAPNSSTEVGGINPSGNLQPLQTDASGNLKIALASDPIDPLGANIKQFGSNNVVTGTGASGLGIPRVTVSNDSNIGLNAGSNSIGTVGLNAGSNSVGTVGLNAGSNNIGSITNITGTVSLPTGAATDAHLTNVQSAPGTPQTVAITVQGNASGVAIPTTVSSLPLPSGAATAALQSNVQSAPGTPQTVALTIQGNASGVSVPVSGTVAATQSGTWNITNISGTVSLPTGAATAANQTNVQSSVGTAASTAFTVQGSNTGVAIPVQPSKGTLTDGSGTTSATPNTSTQIFASNSTRKYLLIQNVGTATIWINFTTSANANQPSIQLLVGGSLVMESSFVSQEAVNVLSGSASVAFTAKQG